MNGKWVDGDRVPIVDAYTQWNFGDGRDYFPVSPRGGLPEAGDQDVWYHVQLELQPGVRPKGVQGSYSSGKLRFQPHVLDLPAGAEELSIVPAVVHSDLVEDILAGRGAAASCFRSVHLGIPVGPGPDAAPCPTSDEAPAFPQETPPADPVVMAVIDDGIAFAHRRFRTPGLKSRVEYAWHQDGKSRGGDGRVCYGREFARLSIDGRKGIDQLLSETAVHGSADEDAFYRETGVVGFDTPGHKATGLRVAHGTHVLDLAAGADPSDNVTNRPIICVELPTSATADTSGASFAPNVLDSVLFILKRADELAGRYRLNHLPVVINLSYGFYASAHDGSHPLEKAFDELIESRFEKTGQRLEIVLPAGNGHLSQCHSVLGFEEPDQCRNLTWRLVPEDRTSSFMEIWLPYSENEPDPECVQLEIVPPSGTASGFLPCKPGSGRRWLASTGDDPAVCWISYDYFGPPVNRGRFHIAVAPTAFNFGRTSTQPMSPSGDWAIRLKNGKGGTGLAPGQLLEAWIQRDDTPYGYLRQGRQSYFIDADDALFDEVSGRPVEYDDPAARLRRYGMLNGIGTGKHTVVVGGTYGNELLAARYSAAGPNRKENDTWPRKGPDALAVSDDSLVHGGVLAAGSRSGAAVVQNGTSVAAPQVARWLADQIHKKPPGYTNGRTKILEKARLDEDALPDEAPRRPRSSRGGAGRVYSLERRHRGI
jgi:hypothetical protein